MQILVCCALNVPYRKGLSDASFMHLFDSIFPAVVQAFGFAPALALQLISLPYHSSPAKAPGYRTAAGCRHPLWRSVRDFEITPLLLCRQSQLILKLCLHQTRWLQRVLFVFPSHC
jgi:hypothetical protein